MKVKKTPSGFVKVRLDQDEVAMLQVLVGSLTGGNGNPVKKFAGELFDWLNENVEDELFDRYLKLVPGEMEVPDVRS